MTNKIVQKKTNQLHTRVTSGQKELITKLANECNLSVTDFIIQSVYDGKIYVVSYDYMNGLFAAIRELANIREEVNAIGRNINQVAKAVNSNLIQDESTLNEYITKFDEMNKLVNEALNHITNQLDVRESLSTLSKLSSKSAMELKRFEDPEDNIDEIIKKLGEAKIDSNYDEYSDVVNELKNNGTGDLSSEYSVGLHSIFDEHDFEDKLDESYPVENQTQQEEVIESYDWFNGEE